MGLYDSLTGGYDLSHECEKYKNAKEITLTKSKNVKNRERVILMTYADSSC